MISIVNFNRTIEEPIINISNDFEMVVSIDGDFTLRFTTYKNLNGIENPGYDLLISNSFVIVEGYEFFPISISNSFGKTFNGINSFYRHSKTRINEFLLGDLSLEERLNFVFNELDYTFTVDDDIKDDIADSFEFGNNNVISLVNEIKTLYNVEYEIMPNKVIHFARRIGKNEDFQFRYKYNITDVILNEQTDNLYTKITGIGADGLTVTYNSPNQSIFGVLEAEPVTDERYTDEDELLNYIKSTIIEEPLLSIQSNVIEMTNRNLGETIWYIYEPLNLEMQTRIIEQTFKLDNYRLYTSSVVFGNSIPSSIEELNIKETEKRKELSDVAVKQTETYRGVSVTKQNGFVHQAGNIITTANADVGFRITDNDIVKFAVDALGQLLLDGRLKITSSNGTIPLLDAFLDQYGGRLDLYDVEGNLNVRTGSEERNGNQKGGIINLYDDGESNIRVQMGALAAYGGNGSLAVYDSSNRAKAGIFAVPGNIISGLIYVNDGSGNTVTSLSASEGRINNELIATQPWVANYVANALANYTPPSP